MVAGTKKVDQYNTNSKSIAGNAVILYPVGGLCHTYELKPELSALCSLLNRILSQNPMAVAGESDVTG